MFVLLFAYISETHHLQTMGLVLRHGVERTTADIEDLQIEEPHGALASLAAFAASWISWKKPAGVLGCPES